MVVYRYLFLYTIYGPRRINPIAVIRQKIDIPNFNGTNFSGIDTLISLLVVKEGVILSRVVTAFLLMECIYSSGLYCASHTRLSLLASSGINIESLLVSCMDSNNLLSFINSADNPRKSR